MNSVLKPLGAAGYSMIELLTVLVIIGIGASVATPAIASYIDQARSQRALDRLVVDVSYARMMAVEDGRKSAIRVQADGTYTIETLAPGGAWTPIRTVRLGDDYPGIVLSGTVSALEFSSRGLVENLAGEAYIKVSVHGARDSVFVSPAGRAYRDF